MQDALKRLEVDASRHKERLQENAALLQFMWKGDVVESWIGKFDTREISNQSRIKSRMFHWE